MLIRTLLVLFALTLAVALAIPVEDQPVAQLAVGDTQQLPGGNPQQGDGDTAPVPTDDLKTDASYWGWGGYGGWGGYYRPRYGYYRPRYYNPYYGYGGYGGYNGYSGGWGGYWG